MDALLDAGLAATRWLQTTYPQLAGFFNFISTLGLEEFYLVFVPLIYWSIDKRLGKHLAYVFLLANALNALGKHVLRGPRPFWLDPNIGLWDETSYGVPSGHAQLTAAIYLFLALWLRRWWVWLLAILFVLLMMISRVYLGAHFLHDVILGMLLSVLLLLGYVVWQRRYAAGFGKRILGYRLMVAVLVPLGFVVLYVILRLIIGVANEAVDWGTFVPGAELSGLEGMATAVGSLLGAGIGLTLEGSRVRFVSAGSVWQRIGRFLLGISVTLALWYGLGQLFPDDPLWLAIPLRIFRYTLILLWVSYFAPLAFVRTRLAAAEPAPRIEMTPP
ncbi:MAG: phosphatase PAP2 family protein [Anaerolineales bacterium]|nr:phosphatase PAP2 family protein [Anaerolineales bacterium]